MTRSGRSTRATRRAAYAARSAARRSRAIAFTAFVALAAGALLAGCASAPAARANASAAGASSGAAGASAAGALSAAPSEAFHVLSSSADFARLGLSRTRIEPWEDGRRTPEDRAHYEWWYFDGLLDDGTVVVAWLGDNWPFGSGTRNVDLEITPPGQATKRFFRAYTEAGSFATERADARIAGSSFSGDLGRYHIVVDPDGSGGLGVDLTLTRTIPSYRPATGYMAAGSRYFAWLVAVPNGELNGTVTVDGTTREVRGSGYHDHNWGNVSPAELMDNWWWGRAVVGERTVIVSELRAKGSVGGARVPLYFVATPERVEVNAFGASGVTVAEGAPVRHPDPRHVNPIASWISFTDRGGIRALFPISHRMLTSADLLAGSSWLVRAVAWLEGVRPWYTRFFSTVTLDMPGGAPQSGEGTLEYFEFR